MNKSNILFLMVFITLFCVVAVVAISYEPNTNYEFCIDDCIKNSDNNCFINPIYQCREECNNIKNQEQDEEFIWRYENE